MPAVEQVQHAVTGDSQDIGFLNLYISCYICCISVAVSNAKRWLALGLILAAAVQHLLESLTSKYCQIKGHIAAYGLLFLLYRVQPGPLFLLYRVPPGGQLLCGRRGNYVHV